MALACEMCGKKPRYGNTISHAHNVTRRRWNPNLRRVKAVINGAHKHLRVCTSCIRSGRVQKAALNRPFPGRSPGCHEESWTRGPGCGACLVGCRKETAPGPDVWAVVNGKEIQRAEVEKYYRTRVNADAPTPSHEEALSLKLNVLDELVNSEILLERANKLNLVASDAEVEDKFSESKSAYTEDEFQKKLKDSELTVDDIKGDIRRELSVEKLLNREVVAKISISDQDVPDFYNKNRAQFDVAEPQFHIAQIVVTPHPDPTVHNRKNDKATSEPKPSEKSA